MKTTYFLILLAIFSCSHPEVTFRRTASGLEFKIYPAKSHAPLAGSGVTVKLYQYWYWHDSLQSTNCDTLPTYQPLIPGLIFPYHPYEALIYGVREGDSVVVMLRVDSLVTQKKVHKAPLDARPGDAWVVAMKVLKVFPFNPLTSDSLLVADKQMEWKRIEERGKRR